MKAAGHELRGMQAYFQLGMPGIHIPLVNAI